MRQLQDRHVSLIELALRIARDKFKEDAATSREAKDERLALTFEEQANDAELLRQAFEDSPEVTLRADDTGDDDEPYSPPTDPGRERFNCRQ